MPHWFLKAGVQGFLSHMPSPQKWNRFFQKHVTKTLTLREPYFLEKWAQCQRHVSNVRNYFDDPEASFTALEIGTGWFPINAIGLALCGASSVKTIDMQDLLKPSNVRSTVRMYLDLIDRRVIDLPQNNAAYDNLKNALALGREAPVRDILAELGVESVIADVTSYELSQGWVDLICSNNTLEHIPRRSILDVFRALSASLSTRGLMSHHIDLADHYAEFDRTITEYNFLRFSTKTWALFNNDIQWQNRLRISDYRELHSDSGWQILEEDSERHPLEVIRSVPLAQEFRRYTEDDLRVVTAWITSVPKTSTTR